MIVERYLFREIVTTLVAITSVLFLIFVSSWFARLLGRVAAGSIQPDVIFLLLGLKSVDALMILLPLAFFLAVLLAFGRLYKDSEMVAMLACGVSLMRITKLVFWTSVLYAILVASISLYFAPLAKAERYKIQEQMKASSGLEAVAAGQFRELASGNVVFYAEKISDDGEGMENIFIQGVREGVLNLMVAERAYQKESPDGGRYLVLENGHRYEGDPGSANFRIIDYRSHEILVSKKESVLSVDESSALTTQFLWESDKRWHKAELQWRLSMPLSAVLLAILAVFLSRTNPRKGRYGKFFLGVLVYIVYNNLMGVARGWIEQGKLDPMIGIWWVHLLLLVMVVVMFVRHMGGLKVLINKRKTAGEQLA